MKPLPCLKQDMLLVLRQEVLMTTEKIPLESIATQREPIILDRPTPSGSDLISGKNSDRIQNEIQVLELERRRNSFDTERDVWDQYRQTAAEENKEARQQEIREREAEAERARQQEAKEAEEARQRESEEKRAEERSRQQQQQATTAAENARKAAAQQKKAG